MLKKWYQVCSHCDSLLPILNVSELSIHNETESAKHTNTCLNFIHDSDLCDGFEPQDSLWQVINVSGTQLQSFSLIHMLATLLLNLEHRSHPLLAERLYNKWKRKFVSHMSSVSEGRYLSRNG